MYAYQTLFFDFYLKKKKKKVSKYAYQMQLFCFYSKKISFKNF